MGPEANEQGEAEHGARPPRQDLAPALGRWQRQISRHHPGQLLPDPEAARLLALVTRVLDGDDEPGLAAAALGFGRCYDGVEPLMDHLQLLGDVLATLPAVDEGRLHGVVTTVLANASVGATDRLVSDSRTDQLTGVGNRRAYDEALRGALSVAARQIHPVAVAIVDLDSLKKTNDEGGHLAGDKALVALARALEGAVRAEDAVFRVGGDEFAVVMPHCTGEEARRMLERIAGSTWPRFSWGVSHYPHDGASPELLTTAADVAMYRRRQLRLVSRSPVVVAPTGPTGHLQTARGRLVVGAATALAVLGSTAAAATSLIAAGSSSSPPVVAAAGAPFSWPPIESLREPAPASAPVTSPTASSRMPSAPPTRPSAATLAVATMPARRTSAAPPAAVPTATAGAVTGVVTAVTRPLAPSPACSGVLGCTVSTVGGVLGVAGSLLGGK